MSRLFVFMISMVCLAAMPGAAFVVEGPKEPATSAETHLASAARWSVTSGAMIATGERGLGGGLEYAIHPSLCQMSFIDGASCAARKAALSAALDEWASGHPAIRFVDVTDRVRPAYPRRSSDDRFAGAEIDFFATNRRQFRAFNDRAVNGYTVFYDTPVSALALTNGTYASVPISRIEGADVHFNREACYYIDIAKRRDTCVHFPSLVLHEISHTLGIGHPEDRVHLNLDNDLTPGNEIPIDCRAPGRGLKVNPNYDGAALAHGLDVQGPGRWRRGLTWDDAAARDALYPHCGIQRIERANPNWGAFALGEDGSFGFARFSETADGAGRDALSACREGGVACRLVSTFQGCFAFAMNAEGAFGHAQASRSDHARVDAVLSCTEAGPDCKVTTDFCAYE